MRKTILYIFIGLLLSAETIIAQQLDPCGTVSGRSKWLKQYQANPGRFTKGADSTLYVPMTIHILGTNGGGGYFRMPNFLDAFCRLTADFEGTNIHLYIDDINYINNSNWYQHQDIPTGAAMMFENNVENTLNVYFVDDPAGNCGYNLPYAGIANAKNCSGPNDHTWAHEVGHAFTLPHPFLGWEGGISYDGSINHNFDDPAPREVYYDYTLFQQDRLYLDTLIIDTALVELIDGSNCYEAADGFCDTEPDYLASRWQCNDGGRSPRTQTDPNGQKFSSDASLIMSYASDQCAGRFTPEQIAAMRANLLDQKATWLKDQTPLGIVSTDPMVINSPFQEEITPAENIYFEWEAVENATHYVLQVSRLSSFAFNEVDVVVEDTSFEVESLRADRKYYWRIRPYNNYSACTSFTETFEFQTSSSVTSTKEVNSDLGLTIYPNLIQKGASVQVYSNISTAKTFTFSIYDLNGSVLKQEKLQLHQGNNTLPINLHESGIYLLEMKNKEGIQMEKIVVQK